MTDLALGAVVSVVALLTMVAPSPCHVTTGPLGWVLATWVLVAFTGFNSTLIWLARRWWHG